MLFGFAFQCRNPKCQKVKMSKKVEKFLKTSKFKTRRFFPLQSPSPQPDDITSGQLLCGGLFSNDKLSNWFSGQSLLTSPLVPSGEICSLGEWSSLCSTQGVNTLHCLEEWRGEQKT
jgi:hypothetical protein